MPVRPIELRIRCPTGRDVLSTDGPVVRQIHRPSGTKANRLRKKMISNTGTPCWPVHFTIAASPARQTIALTLKAMPRVA